LSEPQRKLRPHRDIQLVFPVGLSRDFHTHGERAIGVNLANRAAIDTRQHGLDAGIESGVQVKGDWTGDRGVPRQRFEDQGETERVGGRGVNLDDGKPPSAMFAQSTKPALVRILRVSSGSRFA
jgi:hypothetical protein